MKIDELDFCTEFAYRGKRFALCSTIIEREVYYVAIDTDYVDDNGRVTRELNGLQVYLSSTLNGTIEAVKQAMDTIHYMQQGYRPEVAAYIAVFGTLPD